MRLTLSKIIDTALLVIKWPLAILIIFYYTDIFKIFITSGAFFLSNANILYIFGALFFLITNYLGRYGGNKFLVWEHELSHAIFAWVTFKQNVRIKVLSESNSMGHDGYCTYTNGSNWLITIAPYFFPTLTLLLSLLYPLISDDLHFILDFALGFSITYHLKTNFLEVIHNFKPSIEDSSTDLTRVGRIYALIMIPPLNFVTFSFIFTLLVT